MMPAPAGRTDRGGCAADRAEEAGAKNSRRCSALVGAQRETAALDRAGAEEAARRQADIGPQNADAAPRLTAERDRADGRCRPPVGGTRHGYGRCCARLSAERDAATADANRLRRNATRPTADAARVAAESATRWPRKCQARSRCGAHAAQSQAQDAQAQSEHEKNELRDRLREQLNVILETRESARGLIVNLSDVLFDTGKRGPSSRGRARSSPG